MFPPTQDSCRTKTISQCTPSSVIRVHSRAIFSMIMDSSSSSSSVSIALLILAIAVVGSHATGNVAGGIEASGQEHHQLFIPGPWKNAHATFYGGSDIMEFAGACGYDQETMESFYGMNTTATSNVLFNDGKGCGSCYEIKCVDSPQWCKPGQPSLKVTATNNCPPNYDLPSDNGGWCNPPREHFDLARPIFSHIADEKAGIIPVQYRRIPCRTQGGIRFTITGNHYWYKVTVSNVGGAGDVTSVEVMGHDEELPWTELEHDFGANWKTSAILEGQSLTFRVGTSDGRFSTSSNVTPKGWQFGQTYVGKNFL